MGPIDAILCGALPEPSPEIPVTEFLLPVVGLGRVFHFRASAIARMIGVDVLTLKEWLRGAAIPQGETRTKLAMVAAFYEQLAHRFEGKLLSEFYSWMDTPLEALGRRRPAQALLDGHPASVVRLLALQSLAEERNQGASRLGDE
jgi:hypothetical protein